MIACNHGNAARHEQVSRAGRFKRTAKGVTNVDDLVNAFRINFSQHSLQGRQVAKNVRNDSDFQGIGCCKSVEYSPTRLNGNLAPIQPVNFTDIERGTRLRWNDNRHNVVEI